VSVFKRGEIWWYDFTVRGERFRGSTGARLKEDALVIEKREHRRALMGGLQQRLTLADAADIWFRDVRAGSKSAQDTADRIKIMLRHVPGTTLVSEIGARMITQALNDRRVEPIRRGKNRKDTGALPSNATVNRDMIDSTLRPILRYAAENLEAEVKAIPWRKLRLPEAKGRHHPFNPDQIAAWRAALPVWHRPVLDFILRYGVRLREAFFPLEAIHDHGDVMDVHLRDRKNGEPHVVTLIDEDAALMRARLGRARAAELDTVWFREMKNGSLRPIAPRGFQSASDRALDEAGLSGARPAHDARHHAATTFLRHTGDLAAVKELLGHESIQSTMRYAHTSRADLRRKLRHAYGTIDEPAPEKPRDNKRIRDI
jgi:site-specific recombinase XerC